MPFRIIKTRPPEAGLNESGTSKTATQTLTFLEQYVQPLLPGNLAWHCWAAQQKVRPALGSSEEDSEEETQKQPPQMPVLTLRGLVEWVCTIHAGQDLCGHSILC